MKLRPTCFLIFMVTCVSVMAQNTMNIDAKFDISNNRIQISQEVSYTNESQDTLKTIYLNDWSNSYSTKKTPLAIRFAEEYSNKFHFADNEQRGYTVITSITNSLNTALKHERLKDHPDVIKVDLATPLLPNEQYNIQLNYIIQIPSDTFTRYGVSALKDYNLKDWYITPAIYNGTWHYYSNKNLDDLYVPKSDITLKVTFPRNYVAATELDLIDTQLQQTSQTHTYFGKDRVDSKFFLQKLSVYKTIQTDQFSIVTNYSTRGLDATSKAMIVDNITRFIDKNLGSYPHQKLIVSEIDTKKDPVYGLNQLPDFISPFPKNFLFELQLLKSTLGNFLDNTLLINPRKEQWLKDGIQIYFLIKYIEEYYPDMKLLGSLADIWGIRSFHAADLKFNEQYALVYMHMARTNRDQALNTSKDSLLKFNQQLANKYKAGVGFKYLDDYINKDVVEQSIKDFLTNHKLRTTSPKQFENLLKSNTPKNIDWFFKDYVTTNKKIDFKIKKVIKTEDSITVTIKNKRNSQVPVSLYTLNNDTVTSKIWVDNIGKEKMITIPNNDIDKLVLNYDHSIPEYNLRDNWKSLGGFLSNNKPLQLRLFKDVEDPSKTQLFLMPLLEFKNIYDGLSIGSRFYNKTFLRRNFNYKITPNYGTKSKALVFSGSAYYTQNIENKDLYAVTYGLTGKYSSFGPDLFTRIITPYITLNFRDHKDYRSNKYEALNFRYFDINKDEDPLNISRNDVRKYQVFNVRYINTNPGLINYNRWFTDFQLSKDFGKLSFNYEYRKLFENNRQINLRFFAGTFLYNNTPLDQDYFSFALDRPTDYLFDYNYLGRSESSGIFSQQIIIAEGGFKSKLDTPFANQWMATANISTSIWKYIHAYTDFGFVKNKYNNAKFQYDSGVRVNLVADYFEVYFPIYSNLGWEVGQPDYDQKIRFVFTVDPQVLLGLFRRKWY